MSDGTNQSDAKFSVADEAAAAGREQNRYSVDFSVTVDSDSNFYAGAARNLSPGGIFIATSIVHPVGTRFQLSIHIDDGRESAIRGVGQVRWIRELDGDLPQGLGVRFLEVEEGGRERIAAFLATREPMVVDRPSSLPPGSTPS